MNQRPYSEVVTHVQEIPCLLWNPSGHYRVHICVPLDPIQS
jgi:hypothetical protein